MNFIKRDWKAFWIWVRHHRIKSTLFFVVFAGLATGYAEHGTWPYVVNFFALLGVLAITINRDNKALILIVLSLGLLLPPRTKAQENPEPGGVAVGCAVVVIGGVAVYYMYSFCKKHFPKPDTNQVSHLTGDATYSACQQSFNGYCYENTFAYRQELGLLLPDSAKAETLIEGTVGGDNRIDSIRVKTETYDKEEFQAYLQTQGLPVGQLGTFHAINGQPCEPWQSPIQFTANGIIIVGSNPRTNVVERSHDLVEWTPILTNIMPANLRFQFTDNSDSPQTYYRIKL